MTPMAAMHPKAALAAIVGALVIVMIRNGIGCAPACRRPHPTIITGAVLLTAAGIDALSRRRSIARRN
jgi:ABC-type xylose transport system permease subunit